MEGIYADWGNLMFTIHLSCQILTIALLSGIIVEKLIQRKLRKFRKEPLDLFIRTTTLAMTLYFSQLPSLKVRRQRAIALEAFNILNNQTPLYLNDLYHINLILIVLGIQIQ